MLTCKKYGQLGNQMFQVATTIATALRNGTNYLIPPHAFNPSVWPSCLPHLPKYTGQQISKIIHEHPNFAFQPIEFSENACLDGYWQSEKYFADYRNYIIEAFGFGDQKMIEGVVAIHVRRGDYIELAEKHPPVDHEYLNQAMALFPERRFMVFSDDPKWCKANLKGNQFIFMKHGPAIDDLKLMSQCEHFIIANSTYSWWGAWLSQNKNKIVVSPSRHNWFGPANDHLIADHIIPDGWKQISY